MELTTVILIASGVVIAVLLRYIAWLNLEIKRNEETIADLRVSNHEYENKILEYRSEIKQIQRECTEANRSVAAFKKENFLLLASGDKERLKVQILASETNAAVSAEADFARAANRYVENLKRPYTMDASNRAYIQEELKKEQAADAHIKERFERKQAEARLPRPEKIINTYNGVFGPEEIDGFRAALMTDEEFKAKNEPGFRKSFEM